MMFGLLVPMLGIAIVATVLYVGVGYLALKRVRTAVTSGATSGSAAAGSDGAAKSAAQQRKVRVLEVTLRVVGTKSGSFNCKNGNTQAWLTNPRAIEPNSCAHVVEQKTSGQRCNTTSFYPPLPSPLFVFISVPYFPSTSVSLRNSSEQVTKMMALVVGSYYALYAPAALESYVPYRRSAKFYVSAAANFIFFMNALINPFIYAWHSRDFNAAYRRALGRRHRKNAVAPGAPPPEGTMETSGGVSVN